MELIASIGSFVFWLFVATLTVKLAAGWLGAGESGWGRSLGVVLAINGALFLIVLVGGGAATFVPGIVGFSVGVLALIACLVAPVAIVRRMLDTSWGRAIGILLITFVLGLVVTFGVMFAIVTALGLSFAGLLAGIGLASMEDVPPDPAAGNAAIAALEQSVTQLCGCPDEACVEREFEALGNHLMVATDYAERSRDTSAERRINQLLNEMERCQAAGLAAADEPAAPADAAGVADALAALEASVADVCACTDDDCVAMAFDALGTRLEAATVQAEAAGDADALGHIDALLGEMEQCQADQAVAAADATPAPAGPAAAPAEPEPAEEVVATPPAKPPEPAASAPPADLFGPFAAGVDRLCACDGRACAARELDAIEGHLVRAMDHLAATGDAGVERRIQSLLDRMDACAPADVAAAPAPAEVAAAAAPAPGARAPVTPRPPGDGRYGLIPVPVADGGAQLGKLVRIITRDGARHADQLVAWDGEHATLRRTKADGGGRYTVPVADIATLHVFGR